METINTKWKPIKDGMVRNSRSVQNESEGERLKERNYSVKLW